MSDTITSINIDTMLADDDDAPERSAPMDHARKDMSRRAFTMREMRADDALFIRLLSLPRARVLI